ncbi:helix-turn-helix domain-containing protein [Bartonella sp. LJL80]
MKAARKQCGLSAEYVAEHLEIPVSLYEAFEAGTKRLSDQICYQLSVLLNQPLSLFFCGSIRDTRLDGALRGELEFLDLNPADGLTLLRIFTKLNVRDREILMRTADALDRSERFGGCD